MQKLLLFLLAAIFGILSSQGQTKVGGSDSEVIQNTRINNHTNQKVHETLNFLTNDYPHLRLAISGGLSNHTNEVFGWVDGSAREYFNQLRSGTNIGIDLHYYLFKPVGLGIHYVGFNSSSKIKNWSNSEGDNKSNELSIRFIGPSVSTRLLHSQNNNALVFNVAYGYIDYKNLGLTGIENSIKGNSWGMMCNLGYDLGITENFALGLQVAYLSGSLDQITVVEGGYKKTLDLKMVGNESLNRFDYSIGIRFNL